jgi:hypothetical protein
MQNLALSTIIQELDKASIETKISFYVCFIKELTIVNRVIWSDLTITVEQQVERLKLTNEITHRAVNRLHNLLVDDQKINEREIWKLIQDYISQNKDVSPAVAHAIRSSFISIFS